MCVQIQPNVGAVTGHHAVLESEDTPPGVEGVDHPAQRLTAARGLYLLAVRGRQRGFNRQMEHSQIGPRKNQHIVHARIHLRVA